MRRKDLLILGAGPAGCAAAITLARAGFAPTLMDRDPEPRDQLCGGFLSWSTVAKLMDLGIDAAELGAEKVSRLTLCHKDKAVTAPLPHPCLGLSRRTLDTALRQKAIETGSELVVAKIAAVDANALIEGGRTVPFDTLFLATGKRDLRGATRGQPVRNPMIGIRLRVAAMADLAGRIELHLFDSGYAGIVRQEDGQANICLAIRRSLLREAGGKPRDLLLFLARSHPQFAARMGDLPFDIPVESMGAIPYGWIARSTERGIFRLGDQAAVIPSIAGEGIGIALESGTRAARAWLAGGAGAAPAFQRDFARAVRSPVLVARFLARLSRQPMAWRAAAAFGLAPLPVAIIGNATRVSTSARF